MPPVTKSTSNPARTAPSDVRPHAVPDREHARLLDRRASNVFSERQRPIVDRRVRLARVDNRPAELLVSTRERSRAIDESVAAVDHDVRIGADHRHAADRHRSQFRFVILQRFGLVVSEAGAERILGVFEGHESRLGRQSPPLAASKRLRSRSGPMWRTWSPDCCSINPIVTSPDVTTASNASGETPSFSTWRAIGGEGRGALLMRMTAPPRLRNDTSASEACAKEATPLCNTPQMSQRISVIAVRDLAETGNLPDDLRLFLPHRRLG